jgi:hypothetical protein
VLAIAINVVAIQRRTVPIGVLPPTICQGVLFMTLGYAIAASQQARGLFMGRDHEMAASYSGDWVTWRD